MSIILKAENISKQYRLGTVGTGTLSHDLNRWWHQIRGKEDPYLKVGTANNRSAKANEEYVWALRDINFEVQQGEVLGIIGKNGAGKSTLLKILSRVTAPTTGSIITRGRIASLLEVGTGFHPELTGRENVYLNGAILGMTKPEIKSKIDEIIDFSGCEMYIDTPVKRYSSGMTVRLAFAVAAHLEPEILVVDEVLAVGDAEFQKKAIRKMQQISTGEGRTVLFVSHNMASIQNLCTRGIILKNGVVSGDGKIEAIIEDYLSSDIIGKSDFVYNNFSERKGNAEIQLKEVHIYGEEEGIFPKSGKPLNLRFFINNEKKYRRSDIKFDFRIDDVTGQRLLWFSTTLKKSFHEEDIHPEMFEFSMEKCMLNEGTYFVTTYIKVENQVSDWIQNAFSFDVAQGFFYENAAEVVSTQSKVLVDFKLNVYD